LLRRERVYANSLFTAFLSRYALGFIPRVLYPPVDVNRVSKYAGEKEPVVSMLARFRSAKGWDFALRVFKELMSMCRVDAELYLMGAINNALETRYVRHLIELSRELGIIDKVHVIINLGIDDVYRVLNKSMAFIHVRSNEPFSIVVVETIAAGAVPIVHKSGVPGLT